MPTDATCDACGLFRTCGAKNPNLLSAGSDSPSVYVILQSPTIDEDRRGNPYAGAAHTKLLSGSPLRNVPNESLRVAYAVGCSHKKAELRQRKICGARVRKEINEMKPDTILAFGKEVIPAVFSDHEPKVISNFAELQGQPVPYRLDDGTLRPMYLFQAPFMAYSDENKSFMQVWNRGIETAIRGKAYDGEHHYWKENITYCLTMKQVHECFTRLITEQLVAFDFETTSLSTHKMEGVSNDVWSVAFAFEGGDCYSIPLNDYWIPENKENILKSLGKWFMRVNPTQVRVAHNLKFDLMWGLAKTVKPYYGCMDYVGKLECTQLMSYILNELPGTDSLKVAAFAYLGAPKWSIDVTNVAIIPLMDCLRYNAFDAYHTLRLYKELKPIINASKSYKQVYDDVLIPASLRFLDIEDRGLDVNIKLLQSLYDEYEIKLKELTAKGAEMTGISNWDFGRRDLLITFFENKGYKLGEFKTKSGGISVAAASIDSIIEKHDDALAKLTSEYRRLSKLQSTYILGLKNLIYADGKIHANFKVPATVTGRTSSNGPNMQNFPKRKNVEIRRLITAPEGRVMLSCDYGQIEARLFAVVSGDENYLEDLYNHYDIHKEKAIELYHGMLGWSKEDAEKMRNEIKGKLVFASFYGAGAKSIAYSLGIEERQAKLIIDSTFDRYSKIKEWKQEVLRFEAEYGYVESLLGRRRRSPMKSTEILNHTTQSTASDMTLVSMTFLAKKYDCAIMIHDDLTFVLDDDETLPGAIEEITKAMLTIPWVFIQNSIWTRAFAPMEVGCSVGNNWCDLKEIGKTDSVDLKVDSLEASVLEGNKYITQLNREYPT